MLLLTELEVHTRKLNICSDIQGLWTERSEVLRGGGGGGGGFLTLQFGFSAWGDHFIKIALIAGVDILEIQKQLTA